MTGAEIVNQGRTTGGLAGIVVTVTNSSVSKSTIIGLGGNAAGFASEVDALIENCNATETTVVVASPAETYPSGGLVASLYEATARNCYFSGTVDAVTYETGGYVGGIVSNNATVGMFMPAIFFIVALGLGFATGTSWGTFGILIPIALAVVPNDPNLLVVTVAAVLAGAVGGDHVSPISDTTILASAGAQCHHLDHVNTQIPYVIVVASCSFIGYLVAGIADSGIAGFGAGLIVLLCAMGYIYKFLMKA